MSERRYDSDPTVPIPASKARELLANEGHPLIPDEEPTNPEICVECGGSGLTVLEKPGGGYRGPVPCPHGCRAPGARS